MMTNLFFAPLKRGILQFINYYFIVINLPSGYKPSNRLIAINILILIICSIIFISNICTNVILFYMTLAYFMFIIFNLPIRLYNIFINAYSNFIFNNKFSKSIKRSYYTFNVFGLMLSKILVTKIYNSLINYSDIHEYILLLSFCTIILSLIYIEINNSDFVINYNLKITNFKYLIVIITLTLVVVYSSKFVIVNFNSFCERYTELLNKETLKVTSFYMVNPANSISTTVSNNAIPNEPSYIEENRTQINTILTYNGYQWSSTKLNIGNLEFIFNANTLIEPEDIKSPCYNLVKSIYGHYPLYYRNRFDIEELLISLISRHDNINSIDASYLNLIDFDFNNKFNLTITYLDTIKVKLTNSNYIANGKLINNNLVDIFKKDLFQLKEIFKVLIQLAYYKTNHDLFDKIYIPKLVFVDLYAYEFKLSNLKAVFAELKYNSELYLKNENSSSIFKNGTYCNIDLATIHGSNYTSFNKFHVSIMNLILSSEIDPVSKRNFMSVLNNQLAQTNNLNTNFKKIYINKYG